MHLLTFWHLEMVFREVGRVGDRLRYLKRCLQALPFFLPAVFRLFTISLPAYYFYLPALTKSPAQAHFKPDKNENDVIWVSDTGNAEKRKSSSPDRILTQHILVSSIGALPLSYRRLMGTKTIKTIMTNFMQSARTRMVIGCIFNMI